MSVANLIQVPERHECTPTGMTCVHCSLDCSVRVGGRCPYCSKYAAVATRRQYEKRKREGICTRCLNKAVPGLTSCQPHRDGEVVDRLEHKRIRHERYVSRLEDAKCRSRLDTILKIYGPERVEGQYPHALDAANQETYGASDG